MMLYLSGKARFLVLSECHGEFPLVDYWPNCPEKSIDELLEEIRHGNHVEPGIEIFRKDIASLINKDCPSIVMGFNRIVHATIEFLFGVDKSEKRTLVNFERRLNGIYGKAYAYCAVTEVTARAVLHWHGMLWAGIPHFIAQNAAGAATWPRMA